MNYKKLHPDSSDVKSPNFGDAGYDIPSYLEITLYPEVPTVVETGIAVAVPEGYVGIVFGRSGNAFKKNIVVYHHGIIDSSYRGELKIKLINTDEQAHVIRKGDYIAQLVILPVYTNTACCVETLDETERGEKGFGSSGIIDQLASQ